MQNAGQYVPGTAGAHPPQQFVPSEPSPNGGSTTSSLRQFRKRDVDKSHLEQQPKQESHVARVAPHNHYPHVSNDIYRYTSHQFSDYSPQAKYSDIADASQPNPISTSVIQKPKSKDYMEMCNVQQQHLNNQQQYSPDNGQYMQREPTQGYPTGFKPETHYLPKDQHQYQQLTHHPGQPKFNPMMAQNMRKFTPTPADNPFLNKLSKIHPSMARSIISDHHLQDPQPSYSPMDQRGMYAQQNHRYYPSSLHQPNPYAHNPNYSINPSHHYPNYAAASCSYPRTTTMGPITQRYSHMERSISPARRGYPENLPMNHLAYHGMSQKMQTSHNYPQYGGTPEYAQHYQHRRMGQESYLQPCRTAQYMQNHHQISAQEMQDLPESRISPSDSLKKFIENWAADEEPSNEINSIEGNMNLRDNLKVRDDAPPGTVYMINATDVQYFENNGIPIVTSDNGGIQLTSENYQYLLKNGVVENSGIVRIIEANKEISIDSSGNHERVVNLQIMEAPKSDCMMVNKNLRPNDGSMGPNMLPKMDDEARRVVIHQNTVINPGNCIVNERVLPGQQQLGQVSMHDTVVESIGNSKQLVDKNCSPINLDQLEQNLGFSEPDPLETEREKNQDSSRPPSAADSNINNNDHTQDFKLSKINPSSDDTSQNSDDSQNRSPESKSMPIIDLFDDTRMEDDNSDELKSDSHEGKISKSNTIDRTFEEQSEKTQTSVSDEEGSHKNLNIGMIQKAVNNSASEESFENKESSMHDCPLDLASSVLKDSDNKTTPLKSSVIVSNNAKESDVSKEGAAYSGRTNINTLGEHNTDEILNTSNCNDNLVVKDLPKHTEAETNKIVPENTDREYKIKPQDQTTISNETTLSTIERRKRIFSVDNIIHHIGNNMKRSSKDLDLFCSGETLTNFIEKEVEFSSLEQLLIFNYTKNKQSTNVSVKENAPVHYSNIDEPVEVTSKSTENEVNIVCKQQADTLESINGNERNEVEANIKLETNEIISLNEPLKETCEIEQKSVITNQALPNKEKDEESKENDLKPVSDIAKLPLLLDPDERSHTPSDYQYRNAIRVEETSVLLQIAGEFMEITVNIVNGKKVITVVPLSDSTIVDYNDNYEVSANIQDSDIVQLESSGTATENMDVVEYANENNNEKICNENDPHIKIDTSREEQREDNSIIEEDGANEVHLEEKKYEKTEDSFKEVEKCDAQVESLSDLDIQKSNIPANNKDDIQKPTLNVISSESNETIVSDKIKLQDAENVVEIDTKADFSETNCHKEETENSKNTEDLEISLGSNLIESVSETIKPEIESIEVPEVDKETDIIDDSESATVAQSAEDLEIFKSCETKTSPESVTDNEIVQSSKSTEAFTVSAQTSESVLTVVKETDTVDDSHSEEIAESDMFNISETARSANTAINSDIVESLKLSETFKIKGNSDVTETLNTSGHTEISENLVVEIASENSTTIHPGKEADNNDVDKKCTLEKDMSDPELDESQDKLLNNDESTQSIIEPKVYFTPSEPYVANIEPNTYDESHLETETLEYQLEDDVFISEDLSHEIIISEPVEDIGLVEEIDKSIDSSDIPLEPVTTTNEFKETAELLPTISEILEIDESKPVVVELSDKAVNETVNILLENSNQGGQKHEDNKDNFFSSATTDMNENHDKLKPEVLLLTQKLENEPIIRNNKPDVQILSPTSTNIEDHIATSKENVYLQPRRKPSDDDVCESSSIPITTKAAKKLYECDLQIPAVTTSGDVSPKTSKKSIKCQHDTVSSSKKAKVLKESIRCKKNTVKRSKRINEKIKIKNEQKEMLRMLAEKRRQRIELKQSEAIKQDQHRTQIKQNKPAGENKRSHEGCIKDKNSNNPNENDDEYVDFKELLRARKLKKLKKIQEIKRREVKDTRTRAEDASKNERKDSKAGTKVVKVDKSAVVSSSNIRDKRPEKSETCCNGTDNLPKKTNVIKDSQTEMKKRKKSSDSKSNESTKETISKAIKPESANATILLHKIEKEPEIIMTSSTKIKSKSTSEEEAKHEVIDTKPNNAIELENRMKNTKLIEAGTKAEATNIETKIPSLSHNMEKIKEEHNNFRKVNTSSEMKSSFNDNIPSSTSNNSTFVLPVTKDINISSLNVKTHSTTTLKDPRKRSKSYSGQIMVPSVSELIEENNGAVPKKKISLADYVSRKRKSTENNSKAKSEEKTDSEKKLKFDDSFQETKELSSNSCSPRGETVISKKSIKDVKTSFVIHSSDWEDSQSPIPSTKQSNDECLIHDFSGLNKNNYKRPVIDVNELTPLENLKDKKLQEYKDKVDSQLNSLNILIPKAKSQSAENNSSKIGAHRSPESSRLIKKFLNNERMTQSEMDKIREIISYKRLIQHQKNARSPSKSPSSASSSMHNQLPATSSYEVTCLPVSRSPVRCDFPYPDISSGSTYEIKNETKLEAQSREMRLHLKKVNAKRKLESNDETSSSVPLNPAEIRHKKSVDYSVINRLGKDGLPKIIFKRNRQSYISDDIQLVVELERIDNNLEKIEEKYNVTVTRKM